MVFSVFSLLSWRGRQIPRRPLIQILNAFNSVALTAGGWGQGYATYVEHVQGRVGLENVQVINRNAGRESDIWEPISVCFSVRLIIAFNDPWFVSYSKPCIYNKTLQPVT